jgi:hypothetical protein
MDYDLAPTAASKAPSQGIWRAIRLSIVLAALVLGLFNALSFQHKCKLGAKWFENNTPWALPAFYGSIALVPHRHWLAALIVGMVFIVVTFVLVEWYLALVHGEVS